MPAVQNVMRPVVSDDPGLSEEANRLLTGQLRAVIGADEIPVPADWPDHSHDRHATHGRFVATAIMMRIVWAYVGLMIAMVLLIAVISTTSSWVLTALAVAPLLPSAAFLAWMVFRLWDEPEHPDPELSAMLIEEGVGDPDRVFSELIADFRCPPQALLSRAETGDQPEHRHPSRDLAMHH